MLHLVFLLLYVSLVVPRHLVGSREGENVTLRKMMCSAKSSSEVPWNQSCSDSVWFSPLLQKRDGDGNVPAEGH